MFEINDNIEIKKKLLDNSAIYTIENFYKNPDEILNLFLNNQSMLFKFNGRSKLEVKEQQSFNGIYFEDRRHKICCEEVVHVYNFLENICKEKTFGEKNIVLSNCAKFFTTDFNDYQNNYWWPHYDVGYTALIYFNKNDVECGTNLYAPLYGTNYLNLHQEHFCPWKPKKHFEIIKHLKPKYNKLVLFNAKKFLHGMNICNDRYFGDEFRINQVLFFKKKNFFQY